MCAYFGCNYCNWDDSFTVNGTSPILINESQNPKVLFADAVTACDDSCWLRLNGYLFQRETRPIQKWVEQGLFETSVSLIETHHGTMERCTTKVTGKGQQYFVNGFITGRFKVDNQ